MGKLFHRALRRQVESGHRRAANALSGAELGRAPGTFRARMVTESIAPSLEAGTNC